MIKRIVGTASVALFLSGCAETHYSDGTTSGYCVGLSCPVQALMPGALNSGRNPKADFVRPSSDTLKLGQSNYGQVVELMGNPNETRTEALTAGNKVKIITYFYGAATGGEPLESGVRPERVLSYSFLIPPGGDGGFTSAYTSNRYKLVGQQFTSSFKADNTNFDETKMSEIVKGKATQAEVIQLLGNPSATFIVPLVKEASAEAIEYRYQTTPISADQSPKYFNKALRIEFDNKGLASEVNYTSTGSK